MSANNPASPEFSQFIKQLLQTFKLESKIFSHLTNSESLEIYKCAFTHSTVDAELNYEFYEQIGDVAISKFIVNYCYNKFPNLRNNLGVKIVARIRINYAGKQSLSQIADKLGFWNYISVQASEVTTESRKQSILEDVFEAFIGATEVLIDNLISGIGYLYCNHILKKIYDDIQIIITYENLFDAKTRLKEICDYHKDHLEIEYKPNKERYHEGLICSSIIQKYNGITQELSKGEGRSRTEAEQDAAKKAIAILKSRGIDRPLPTYYSKFENV